RYFSPLTGPSRAPSSPPPLHDALPISSRAPSSSPAYCSCPRRTPRPPIHFDTCAARDLRCRTVSAPSFLPRRQGARPALAVRRRSEEHTSELQSRVDLVCRLLLEKKKR